MMNYLLRNIAVEVRDFITRMPRVFLSSFGILFLITVLVLFVSIRRTVTEYIEKRIFGKLQINELIVYPRTDAQRQTFSLTAPAARGIPRGKVAAIGAISGIKNVHQVLRLNAPVSLKVGAFGRYLKTDILVSGVERSFFYKSPGINWRRFTAQDHVPVVVPYFALDLYNNFAAANGMPQFGEKALVGLGMDLTLGSSSFMNGRPGVEYAAKVYGFTSRLNTSGIVVPAEFLRRFCREKGAETVNGKDCVSTTMLFVSVKSPADLPGAAKAIGRMGLRVESQRDIAEKTQSALKIIDAVFGLIMIMVLLLSAVAIFNSYLAIVYHRSGEITLKRVLGVSKLRVLVSFIVEASIVGAAYGFAGFYGGYYSIAFLGKKVPQWIPALRDISLSADISGLLPVAVLLAAAVSAASALVPSIVAANLSLFDSTKQ